ncbi:hypothetical protein RvY_18325-1 [Ramazzottius varieornatus]|uniref:Uncharacterized protein n=1 Tax=Ramazzottius varieornatus TaxID=947166 RepID=A0A1D1W5B8_RAMVA|nr:hypothetical protein RvY_18325-1 [Ramazzottius varieornatus]
MPTGSGMGWWPLASVDTFCLIHVDGSLLSAGYAASRAEEFKRTKYQRLQGNYSFCPVGFETYEERWLNIPGKRYLKFLRQRVSIDIRRGNDASVWGTFPFSRGLQEVFYVLDVSSQIV